MRIRGRLISLAMAAMLILATPLTASASEYDEPYYTGSIEAQKYIKTYKPKKAEIPTRTSSIYSKEVTSLVELEARRAFLEWANSPKIDVNGADISFMIVKPVLGFVEDSGLNPHYQKMLLGCENNGMHPLATYTMVAYVQYTGTNKDGDKVSSFAYFFFGSPDGGKTVNYTEPGWPTFSQYTQTAYYTAEYSGADALVYVYVLGKKGKK